MERARKGVGVERRWEWRRSAWNKHAAEIERGRWCTLAVVSYGRGRRCGKGDGWTNMVDAREEEDGGIMNWRRSSLTVTTVRDRGRDQWKQGRKRSTHARWEADWLACGCLDTEGWGWGGSGGCGCERSSIVLKSGGGNGNGLLRCTGEGRPR